MEFDAADDTLIGVWRESFAGNRNFFAIFHGLVAKFEHRFKVGNHSILAVCKINFGMTENFRGAIIVALMNEAFGDVIRTHDRHISSTFIYAANRANNVAENDAVEAISFVGRDIFEPVGQNDVLALVDFRNSNWVFADADNLDVDGH